MMSHKIIDRLFEENSKNVEIGEEEIIAMQRLGF